MAETVLAYLGERPEASDSVEGILHHWLTLQRARDDLEMLRRVLSRLVSEGSLVEMAEVPGVTPKRYALRARPSGR